MSECESCQGKGFVIIKRDSYCRSVRLVCHECQGRGTISRIKDYPYKPIGFKARIRQATRWEKCPHCQGTGRVKVPRIEVGQEITA